MTESESRRVVVTGATGLVGKKLCARLIQEGYQVVVFSRNPQSAKQTVPGAAEYRQWNGRDTQGEWVGALSGARAVIHMAGASIFGSRWTESYKATLRDSRVLSTRALVEAMKQVDHPPSVFLSGSAVGYYGHRDDTPLDESAAPGSDFLAQLCVEWEREATQAEPLNIRVATLRTGIVMDAGEGALPLMKMPFMFFMGGPILPGSQWFSWVHVDDEVGMIMHALQNEQARGPLNLTAPEPQTNAEFMSTLGKVMNSPSWAPVPGFALKLVLGEFADNLTTGQRAIPAKGQELGYTFQYPTSEVALRHLLKK